MFDTVFFQSNLSSLRRKYWRDVPTDKIVLSSGPKISKRPLKRRYWWLRNIERKCHFRFVERRFLAAINCTGSAEGTLVPVLLRITHWPKSGLPVSPPGLFPPWLRLYWNISDAFKRISGSDGFVSNRFRLFEIKIARTFLQVNNCNTDKTLLKV